MVNNDHLSALHSAVHELHLVSFFQDLPDRHHRDKNHQTVKPCYNHDHQILVFLSHTEEHMKQEEVLKLIQLSSEWLCRCQELSSHLTQNSPSHCIDNKWPTFTITTENTFQAVHMLLKRAPKTNISIREYFKSWMAFVPTHQQQRRLWCTAVLVYYILITWRLKISAVSQQIHELALTLDLLPDYWIACWFLYLFLGLSFSFSRIWSFIHHRIRLTQIGWYLQRSSSLAHWIQ